MTEWVNKYHIKDDVYFLYSIQDHDKISKIKWSVQKKDKCVHVRNRTLGLLHRVILDVVDRSLVVDHINGNGLDNRRENLRVCTQKENCRNRRKHKVGTSKYKGVSMRTNGMYRSRIRKDGKLYHLGDFSTEQEAAEAYNEMADYLFGEFSRENKIRT